MATLLLLGCATARSKPPEGYSFERVTRKDFGIDILVPSTWDSGEYHGGICSFDVQSPEKRVFLRILVVTEYSPETANEYTVASMVETVRQHGYVAEPAELQVGGIPAEGIVSVGRDPEEWVLLVRRPNWVYLLILQIRKSATAAEREAAFYMLEQLKLSGVDFPELEDPDEEEDESQPSPALDQLRMEKTE